MTPEQIVIDLKKTVCNSVTLIEEGNNRFRVFTPFYFSDGDQLCPVLKEKGGKWIFTDEGATFMRLTYDMPAESIFTGHRGNVIERTVAEFQIESKGGVLSVPVTGSSFGNALFSFIQAVLRISDVSIWNRQVVRNSFMDDFRSSMSELLGTDRAIFDWTDQTNDPKGNYPVDCYVKTGKVPLFAFGVHNDQKCDLVTIIIQHFKQRGVKFDSLVIYENQEDVTKNRIARISDVAEKQFSALPQNKAMLADYLGKILAA